MIIPTPSELLEEMAVITGETNPEGNPRFSVDVNSVVEARAAIARIVIVRKRLKPLRTSAVQIQSRIRAAGGEYCIDDILSDLFLRQSNISLEPSSRRTASFMKTSLIDLYNTVKYMIDDLVRNIDGLKITLDQYIIDNK